MDLLLMRTDADYNQKAKIYSISSPSFIVTQNVTGAQPIDNGNHFASADLHANAYSLVLYDLKNQFFNLLGDNSSVGVSTNKLFGFIRIGNHQFITTESKPQNFREQFLAVLPYNNKGSRDFSKDITFSAATKKVDIQFQCDDKGRSRIRARKINQLGPDTYTDINSETGFDQTNIISTMGMRIPLSSITGGVVAIRQDNLVPAACTLIKITRLEDVSSQSLTGINISTTSAANTEMFSPGVYDTTQMSYPIEYYQENEYINILQNQINSFDSSMGQLDQSMTELNTQMVELTKLMNALRKDVDEITSNNAALFVSR